MEKIFIINYYRRSILIILSKEIHRKFKEN